MTIDDAQKLQRTIERLHLETGLRAETLHEMMETVAALLLNQVRNQAFADDSSITVTAEGLRQELLDLGLPAADLTTDNVEKVLEAMLEMAC
ncbi:MAG: hypothetical protein V3U98_00940 [Acidobacteriota bacterium]